MEELQTDEVLTPARSRIKLVLLYGVLVCVVLATLLFLLSVYLNQPPSNFPQNEAIVIAPGSSVRAITEQLADEDVVRSPFLLYIALVLLHEPESLKASTYRFTEPITTMHVANRITTGEFTNDLLRITLVEGERAADYGQEAAAILPEFDAEQFTILAEPHEGTLWPDTYFVPPQFTEPELLTLLRSTYAERTQHLAETIAAHPLTENEIIILASIVEREANSPESMKMVAGILQNRLSIGMALQADASIEYVLETPLNELAPGELATELRELDSPYNTYLYPGLPPTPIGNPGLDAITAVLEPTPSDNLFYITGNDGEFYYAETLDEHNLNIARYLR